MAYSSQYPHMDHIASISNSDKTTIRIHSKRVWYTEFSYGEFTWRQKKSPAVPGVR